jgi:[ribosomal protein S5]-alanine N-acetyltransferase
VTEAARAPGAFLVGERCYLRAPTRDDVLGNWPHWFSDAEVTRNMLRGVFPQSVEAQLAFYEHVSSEQTSDLVLAIVAADTDQHIGTTGLHRIDWVNRSAEFGIVVGERVYWGKGIGSEATRLIVAHGFDRLNLERIWLGVFADHGPAVRLYERVGFQVEGRLRGAILRDGRRHDQLIMGILAEEFRDASRR